MGQKLSKLSCCRRRHRGVEGRSSVVNLPLTPPPKSEDASSSVGAAQSSRSPPISPTPHSDHQPTHSGCMSAEKERSEFRNYDVIRVRLAKFNLVRSFYLIPGLCQQGRREVSLH